MLAALLAFALIHVPTQSAQPSVSVNVSPESLSG